MAFDLKEELTALARAFESEGIEYAVCGGIAVAIHGYPRSTQDLDVLVREEDFAKIQPVVEAAGFTLSAGLIPFDAGKESERRILRVSKASGEDLLTLDLIAVTPALEDVWAGREKRRVGDCVLQVVSRRGLIQMKKIAGRPIDLADVEGLGEEDE
ncbi:nucleotidyltransferase family protein [Candidatus Sumerlaeota bacterium]|nr:nucleotidyltransferase family protein [Candidatus Sumerlaeota bacterium]